MKFDPTILLSLILAVPGLAALVYGGTLLRNRIPLIWRGLRLSGRIARIERSKAGHDDPPDKTPWVTFIDPDGKEQTLRLDHSPSTRPKPGGETDIYIDPARPGRIYLACWPSLALMPITMLLAGLLVTALSAGIFFGREPSGGWPKPPLPPPFTRN